MAIMEEAADSTPEAAATFAATAPSSGGSVDSLLENSAGWGRLAAKILADIPQQPSSLVAGQLREYQLHVSARFEEVFGVEEAGGCRIMRQLSCT